MVGNIFWVLSKRGASARWKCSEGEVIMSVQDPRLTAGGIITIVLIISNWSILYRDQIFYRFASFLYIWNYST